MRDFTFASHHLTPAVLTAVSREATCKNLEASWEEQRVRSVHLGTPDCLRGYTRTHNGAEQAGWLCISAVESTAYYFGSNPS